MRREPSYGTTSARHHGFTKMTDLPLYACVFIAILALDAFAAQTDQVDALVAKAAELGMTVLSRYTMTPMFEIHGVRVGFSRLRNRYAMDFVSDTVVDTAAEDGRAIRSRFAIDFKKGAVELGTPDASAHFPVTESALSKTFRRAARAGLVRSTDWPSIHAAFQVASGLFTVIVQKPSRGSSS